MTNDKTIRTIFFSIRLILTPPRKKKKKKNIEIINFVEQIIYIYIYIYIYTHIHTHFFLEIFSINLNSALCVMDLREKTVPGLNRSVITWLRSANDVY